MDQRNLDAGLCKLADGASHAERKPSAIDRQLAAHLHHEPAAGERREHAHGQSPGSLSVSDSSNPIIKLKLWIACPAPPLTRLSSAEKQTTRRERPCAGPRAKPTST